MRLYFGTKFALILAAALVASASLDTPLAADAKTDAKAEKKADIAPAKVIVGKSQPSWKSLLGTDDKEHSLADLKDREVVVVAITCNHCPIAIEYFERLNEFAKKHCGEKGKVALVAISVSDMETDKLPRMKEVAKRQSFAFPYLYDGSQQIAKDLGATNTPQFFVLDRHRTLAYRGAWDDEVNATKVTTRHVEEAVEALLANKTPLVTETSAKGCLISYKDE